MSIESDILSDLQTRTQSEAELLAMVEAGRDADVAQWYNEVDIPSDELGEGVREFQDCFLTKQGLRDALGDVPAGQIVAGLRAYGGTDGVNAAVVHEAIIAADNGGSLPNLGDPDVRSIITALGTAQVFGDDQPASVAVAEAVLALAPKAKISHLVTGRLVRDSDISNALRPVRENGTATLIENWQTWSDSE